MPSTTWPRRSPSWPSLASGTPSLKLTYPTGLTENGLSFDDAAARLEQYLDQIGITVNLQPQSYRSGLESYRAGTEALGLWYWGPTSADPQDYLNFGSGPLVGPARRMDGDGLAANPTVGGGPRQKAADHNWHLPHGRPIFEQFQNCHEQVRARSSPSPAG